MCVDYIDKHLVNEDTESMLSKPCDFDIPVFEVRESNFPSPEVVSDPPQLCECDDLGSLCGVSHQVYLVFAPTFLLSL